MHKTVFNLVLNPLFVALVVGAAITVGLVKLVWTDSLRNGEALFNAEAGAMRDVVAQKLNAGEEAVYSLSSLFESSLQIDSDQFRLYNEGLMRRHEFFNAVFYLPRVARSERARFEQQITDSGMINFSIYGREDGAIRGSADKEDFYPVLLVEPYKPSTVAVIGFDALSDPLIGQALRKSIIDGAVVAVRTDGNNPLGEHLLLKATYAGKIEAIGANERHFAANAMMAITLNMQRILIMEKPLNDVAVSFYYIESKSDKNTGQNTGLNAEQANPANAFAAYQSADFALKKSQGLGAHVYVSPITFGGKTLLMRIEKVFTWSDIPLFALLGVVCSGLLLTLLMAMLALNHMRKASSLQRQNREIQELVVARTRELALEKESLENEIQARKQTESRLLILSGALEQTADSVIITDRAGVIQYVNPAFTEITGFQPQEALGKKPSIVNSGNHEPEFFFAMWQTIIGGEDYKNVFVNKKKSGELYYEEKTISPLKNGEGKIIHFVSTGKDITKRMQDQEHLHYLAHHDILTSLPNRMRFVERVDQAIALAARRERYPVVMFIDLDRFKVVNDSLGHNMGDCLLKIIAKRLQDCVRKTDTVARLGGDEFTILLEDIKESCDVKPIAEKILRRLSEPVRIDTHELYVSGSIGIAVYPEDGTDTVSLLKHADSAMYKAKEAGKDAYRFFNAEMEAESLERLSRETALRRALEHDEFVLYYQPQLRVNANTVVAVEALLRWHQPEKGLVAPAEFIPLLEETGLIIAVGEWVLCTACRQLKQWHGLGLDHLGVAVNVSTRQFGDANFVNVVEKALRLADLEPKYLELEITEGLIMRNLSVAAEKITRLGELGVRFAIDDFGTGYSSLNYLKSFPINTLKVDKSFVNGVHTNKDDATIVSTIVAMARSLQLNVVAEGVETHEQAQYLREVKCDLLQGFLYSKPLAAEELLEKLQGGALPPLPNSEKWPHAKTVGCDMVPDSPAGRSRPGSFRPG